MNMTYKFWRNAAALSAIVGSVGIAGYAVAAPNNQPSMLAGNGQNRASYQGLENGQHLGWNNNAPRAQLHTPEQREQIQAAVKAGNYEQWKSLVSINGELPKQFQAITADNFAKFAEMHTAMEAKDFDKVNALRQELGLGMGGQKMGAKHGLGQGRGNR